MTRKKDLEDPQLMSQGSIQHVQYLCCSLGMAMHQLQVLQELACHPSSNIFKASDCAKALKTQADGRRACRVRCKPVTSPTQAEQTLAAPVDHEEGAALDERLAQHVLGPPVSRDDGVPVPGVARQLHVAVAAPVEQPAQACVCGSGIMDSAQMLKDVGRGVGDQWSALIHTA